MRSYVAIAILSLSIVACSSGQKQADLTPSAPKQTMERMPDWFLNPPVDANFVLGPATSTSSDMQVALDKAYLTGRNQIAQKLQVKFEGMTKQFRDEMALASDSELLDQFTQAYKGVVDVTLTSSRPRRGYQVLQQDGNVYRVYVLMEMPVAEVSRAVADKVKANQRLYTQMASTQAFKELMADARRAADEK